VSRGPTSMIASGSSGSVRQTACRFVPGAAIWKSAPANACGGRTASPAWSAVSVSSRRSASATAAANATTLNSRTDSSDTLRTRLSGACASKSQNTRARAGQSVSPPAAHDRADRSLPRAQLTSATAPEQPRRRRRSKVLLYCRSGHRADMAAQGVLQQQIPNDLALPHLCADGRQSGRSHSSASRLWWHERNVALCAGRL
jgi:rhodanese-related sulfurtransferase